MDVGERVEWMWGLGGDIGLEWMWWYVVDVILHDDTSACCYYCCCVSRVCRCTITKQRNQYTIKNHSKHTLKPQHDTKTQSKSPTTTPHLFTDSLMCIRQCINPRPPPVIHSIRLLHTLEQLIQHTEGQWRQCNCVRSHMQGGGSELFQQLAVDAGVAASCGCARIILEGGQEGEFE